MSYLRKPTKSLLIFDLNGVLGHYVTDNTLYRSTGIYQSAEKQTELSTINNLLWQDGSHAIFGRPYLRKVTFDMLVKDKSKYDIGIWSSND
jgi:hypothetical protein